MTDTVAMQPDQQADIATGICEVYRHRGEPPKEPHRAVGSEGQGVPKWARLGEALADAAHKGADDNRRNRNLGFVQGERPGFLPTLILRFELPDRRPVMFRLRPGEAIVRSLPWDDEAGGVVILSRHLESEEAEALLRYVIDPIRNFEDLTVASRVSLDDGGRAMGAVATRLAAALEAQAAGPCDVHHFWRIAGMDAGTDQTDPPVGHGSGIEPGSPVTPIHARPQHIDHEGEEIRLPPLRYAATDPPPADVAEAAS